MNATAEGTEGTEYAYEYDALGRVTQETQTIAGLTPVLVFSSQYSVVGLRTELSATIGGIADFVNTYDYDALGRLTQLAQTGVVGGDSVADKRVDFTYDAASRYDTITRYANLAGTDEVATGTYAFDPLGRLTSLVYTQPNSTGLPYYAWTYDAAGNMTWMETIDGEVDYTHDDTNQLTDADYDYQTDENYEYDANGNRTSGGYVTGDNNQLLFDGTYTYQYDAEGNRTLRYVDEDSSGDLSDHDTDVTFYSWDHRNRLLQVDHTDSVLISGTPPLQIMTYDSDMIVDYVYDAFDRLVEREYRSGNYVNPETREVYVHEGGQIALHFYTDDAEYDLTAADLTDRYLWNPQAADQLFADEQIHWDDQQEEYATDEVLWALTDHLNSVRDGVSYDSQSDETTVRIHRVFDAFGNLTDEQLYDASGESVDPGDPGALDELFRYTAKLFDADTELQINWFNWYDAKTARWLGEDKAQSDVNLTRYCHNSPLTHVDPLGMWRKLKKAWNDGVYEAERDGETLQELARMVSNNQADWVCIWPLPDLSLWVDYPTAKKCAKADVSNLIIGKYQTKKAMMVNGPESDSFLHALRFLLSTDFGNAFKWNTAQQAVDSIKATAKEGATPIQRMILGGHSCHGATFICNQNGSNKFDAGDILRLSGLNNSVNILERASQWKGPPRCWFTRDARVWAAGCHTSSFAQKFATDNLRKGAFAWGTTITVWGTWALLSNGRTWYGVGPNQRGGPWYSTIQQFIQAGGIWSKPFPGGL